MPTTITALEVKRDDLRAARIATQPLDQAAATAAGKTVLKIDRFALTANNITYGAFGEQMSYWAFFPASDGFGHIPVWGFATVEATPAGSGLAVGERIYGYLPMASHLLVEAGKVTPARFVDLAAHRAKLPPVYNAYERMATATSRNDETYQMILRPLLMTSFLIADFLDDNAMFGARQVLVSSASSKTSLGLAHCLRQLGRPDVRVVGLTSPANRSFVEATGQYDAVVAYEEIAALDGAVPTVYVDMAGSADVLTKVHGHFRERLRYSCRVGGTHWTGLAGRMDLPGARPVFFFAPTQIQKRLADWGAGGLEARYGARKDSLAAAFSTWMTLDERHGADAVLAAYRETLEGRQRPQTGLILSFA